MARTFLVAMAAALGACRFSSAAPILDQSYETPPPGNTIVATRFESAQTFTVGITGSFTSVDVNVGRYSDTPGSTPLTVDVRRTVAGVPVEEDSGPNVLASLTKPASSLPQTSGFDTQFVNFDLADFPVTSGEILAIVLRTSSTGDRPFAWAADAVATYAGGRTFARGTSAAGPTWGEADTNSLALTDHEFRTYVDPVPEPASLLLSGGAMLACLLRRRARRPRNGSVITPQQS